MVDQARTLTIRQVLDAGSYVSGARDIASANRDMSAGARTLATDFSQVQVRLSSAADPVSRLTRAYDQAGASQGKFTSDLRALNTALETSKVSAESAGAIYAGMVSRLGMMADGAHLAGQGFAAMGRIVEETNRAIMSQATAARATAEAAREMDLYAQKAVALRAVLDPIGTSQNRLNAEIAEYSILLNRAEISTTEFAQAQQMARQRHDEFVASLNRSPANDNGGVSNEAQYRRQNLGMQLFDVGQSVSLGMNPAMILAQQGPQIAQIYAMQGGLNAAMRDFGVILGGVARVAGPLVGILAGVYGAYKILESNSVAAGLGVSEATRAMATQAAPISSLKGQIDELAQVQAVYNKALAESALASSSAITLILANSQREYEARKALLELELLLQEAKLKTQQADIAIAGQGMRERLSAQVATDPNRLVRDGFADPRINGGIAFVRVPDEISGLQKTMDDINADPANTEIAKMRAEMTLAQIVVEKLRDALKKPFEVAGDPLGDNYWSRYSSAMLDKQKALNDGLYNPVPNFPNGVPIPEQRPIDGGDEVKNAGALMQQQHGARSTIAEQVQARQQLMQTQSEEIQKLQLEAQLVGASARERATMTAALQAEQQLRQQGISLLSAEGQAYRANAVMMANARLEIERQNAAYSSLEQAGGSAIDSLTVGTGSLKDRLKAAADTMLQWIQQLTIANPLKNALFGSNLPTMSDLFSGRPAMPGATSTASMMVTAGTVMVNGGVMGGQFPSIPGTSLPGTATGGGLLDFLKTPAPANANNLGPFSSSVDAVNALRVAPTDPSTRALMWRQSISQIESGSFNGNYNALGPVTRSGDQAYGRYQVMGANVPSWTAEHYGQRLTPSQFLGNRAAQDSVFDGEFGSYVSKYGEGPAATKWFTGSHIARGRTDINGTVDSNYQSQFESNMRKLSQTTVDTSKSMSVLDDSTAKVSTSITDNLGKLATPAAMPQVPAVTPTAPVAGANPFSLFSGFFKLFGFADGTDFSPGGMAMVGERGPEPVFLPRGSRVVPNHKMNQMFSGGAPQKVQHNHAWNVQVSGMGDKDLIEKVTLAARTSVETANRDFSDNHLPGRIQEIARNPDFIGGSA